MCGRLCTDKGEGAHEVPAWCLGCTVCWGPSLAAVVDGDDEWRLAALVVVVSCVGGGYGGERP